jgi:hypothetical protein
MANSISLIKLMIVWVSTFIGDCWSHHSNSSPLFYPEGDPFSIRMVQSRSSEIIVKLAVLVVYSRIVYLPWVKTNSDGNHFA